MLIYVHSLQFLADIESYDVIEQESSTSSFGDEEGDEVEDAEENKMEGGIYKHMRTLSKMNGKSCCMVLG